MKERLPITMSKTKLKRGNYFTTNGSGRVFIARVVYIRDRKIYYHIIKDNKYRMILPYWKSKSGNPYFYETSVYDINSKVLTEDEVIIECL